LGIGEQGKMMTQSESENIEQLVTDHLAGEHPNVPASHQQEFDLALAAHAALQGFIDETVVESVEEPNERHPPDLPDGYQIEREIGKGGMGVVYLVHQQSLNRDVALKVLRPGEQTFGPLVKRFLGEAKHLARLRHPNIVSIHEVGDAQGEPYFTMDYIEGEPLSAAIRRGPMSPTQALSILKQVAEAVQHAHRQGIIHRDLKPSNVLIDNDGTAFVTDFGLARDVSQSSDLTQTGELLGTPQYMSPEQARGQSSMIGEATDIHALGLLLFEMLTGKAAFASSSPADVLVRLLNEDPPPLRSLDRRIPRDLETICQKTLQKSPAARYASVSALLEDIRRFESGEPLVARRTSIITRAARWSQRHWKLATAVAGTATVMLLIAIAVGPQLFDKTSEELIAWAEELHTDGKHAEAIDVYRRALETSEADQRSEILRLMIRCCGEIDDAGEFIAAAVPLLKERPDAAFGRHDYLAAQALYTNLMDERPHLTGSATTRSEDDYTQLAFAARRYEIFLNGRYGSEQEREFATGKLDQINRFLDGQVKPPKRATLQPVVKQKQLPDGSVEELLATAADVAVARWQRGKAAYAAGLLLEQSDNPEAAKPAFHEAFDLMRVEFPTYEGISTRTFSTNRRVEHVESAECALLRDVFAAVRRLDPDVTDMLQGGLRFRIEGMQLPKGLSPKLRVELYDQTINTSAGRDRSLPRIVPIQNQTAFVGVADGRYRVAIRNAGSTFHGEDSGRLSSLLELDLSKLPKEVEVKGNTLEFAIPASTITEIMLLEPAVDDTVDLRSDVFRWSMAEGADFYRLVIVSKDSRVGDGNYFKGGAAIRVNSNNVCLGTLPESERNKAAWLTTGATATWSVQAYDEQGRPIGASVQNNRTFLVGRSIDDGDPNR
jgi:predicted Ser/Thr protein kinase